MNDLTGEVHKMREGETMKGLSKRIGVPEKHLVPLGKEPEQDCIWCKGRGSVSAGIGSKRFKPCKCTYA